MDLVAAWRRRLLAAGGAAAILPVATVAALVVTLVGSGGLGSLGSLGQLFSGPRIAPEASSLVNLVRPGPATSGAPVRRATPAPVRRSAPVQPPRASTPQVANPCTTCPASPPRKPVPVPVPVPVVPLPPTTSAPPRRPTLKDTTKKLTDNITVGVRDVAASLEKVVDHLGKGLTDLTDRVPAPVGPPVSALIDRAVKTVDALIPPPRTHQR